MSEKTNVNPIVLREGYIRDRVTGKEVRNTPEEQVRQDYEKVLNEDYDYDYEQMEGN